MPHVRAEAGRILSHLLVRSGLLRQSADGEIGFLHQSFQDYLAAEAIVEADDLGLLARRAHEDQWQNVGLHGLAAQCLPYATELAPNVREWGIQRATGSGL
ncbi:hypothetical protein AB0F18_14500 [Streptomyces sp. NPDC029216]|uniref:hypothetical protein n=1 Tax=Streptomyces sp. NPDC029216 TaxID=3154701 RepID=UPI0033F641FD